MLESKQLQQKQQQQQQQQISAVGPKQVCISFPSKYCCGTNKRKGKIQNNQYVQQKQKQKQKEQEQEQQQENQKKKQNQQEQGEDNEDNEENEKIQLICNLKRYGWSPLRINVQLPALQPNQNQQRQRQRQQKQQQQNSKTTTTTLTKDPDVTKIDCNDNDNDDDDKKKKKKKTKNDHNSMIHVLKNYHQWKSMIVEMFPLEDSISANNKEVAEEEAVKKIEQEHEKEKEVNDESQKNTRNTSHTLYSTSNKNNTFVQNNINPNHTCDGVTWNNNCTWNNNNNHHNHNHNHNCTKDSMYNGMLSTSSSCSTGFTYRGRGSESGSSSSSRIHAMKVEPKQSWEWKRTYYNVALDEFQHGQEEHTKSCCCNCNCSRNCNCNCCHCPCKQKYKWNIQYPMIGWTTLFHTIAEYIINDILQLPHDFFVVDSSSISTPPTSSSTTTVDNLSQSSSGECIDLLRAFYYDVEQEVVPSFLPDMPTLPPSSVQLPLPILPNENENTNTNTNTRTRIMGSNEHTDWGSLTIVWQDYNDSSHDCLQTYCTESNRWISINHPIQQSVSSSTSASASASSTSSSSSTTSASPLEPTHNTDCTEIVQLDVIVHVGDMTSLAIRHATAVVNHQTSDNDSRINSKKHNDESNTTGSTVHENCISAWPSPLHRVLLPTLKKMEMYEEVPSDKNKNDESVGTSASSASASASASSSLTLTSILLSARRCSLVYFCYPPPNTTIHRMIDSLIESNWIHKINTMISASASSSSQYCPSSITTIKDTNDGNSSNSSNTTTAAATMNNTIPRIPYENYYLLVNQSSAIPSTTAPLSSSLSLMDQNVSTESSNQNHEHDSNTESTRTNNSNNTSDINENDDDDNTIVQNSNDCHRRRAMMEQHFHKNVLDKPIWQVLEDKWKQVQR